MAERDRETGGSRGRAVRGLALALLLIVAQGLAAQERARWITDQLEVDMRRGQGNRFAITRMLPSGTRVELIEADAETGYSRVRTPSGAEGWVLSRFLDSEPPARLRLPEVEARHRTLQQQQSELSDEARALRGERDGLQREISQLQSASAGLEKDLAEIRTVSADALKTAEENRALQARAAAAEQRANELEARNLELTDQGRRNWFLAGAGVLLLGFLLGLVLPRIRWKKKSAWGDRL